VRCSQWENKFKDRKHYCLSVDREICSPSELDFDECIDDLAPSFLIKTSGSSGEAKWVVYSKECLLEHAVLVRDHLKIGVGDNLGLMLPTHHVGGLGVIARSIVSGANLVRFDEKWSAIVGLRFLTMNKISVVSLVPTQLVDLVRDRCYCPASVRIVIVGGGKLDEVSKLAAIELGWPIYESYGMTETGSQIATGALGEDGYLRLIDGWQVNTGEDSLLEVKGACLFSGYLTNKNGQYVFLDPKENGWFKTSDRVSVKITEKGIGLRFLSRGDQMVKILGELVNVSVLESRLVEFLGVEVYLAVFNDERRGSKLVPVANTMRLASKIDEVGWRGIESLEKAVVVSDFPKNEMGKLNRFKLIEQVESIVFPAS